MTKNIKDENKDDFLIHVQGEYDYRFKSDDREMIFKLIIEQHTSLTNETLPVFGVNGKIDVYATDQK